MTLLRKDIGRAGERAACRYLRRRGYRLLERNFTCSAGEIDLVCYGDGCIVFVEVKTLTDDAEADPEDKITPTKQRQVARAARVWLAEHREPECAYRFDAVSVVLPRKGRPRIRHIAEAFSASVLPGL
ncbi:MAG: YraN family protein [Phycisphaerae bacterium]